MTTKQDDYIQTLVSYRLTALGHSDIVTAMGSIPLDTMSTKDKSNLIDRLLKVPTDPDPRMPEVVAECAGLTGVNKFAKDCVECGHTVEARAGYFYKTSTGPGGYRTIHAVGECDTSPAPVMPNSGDVVRIADGRLVKIVRSQAGRLYGKVLTGIGTGNRLTWSYDGSIISQCKGAEVVTDNDVIRHEAAIAEWGFAPGTDDLRNLAVQWAKVHDACMFCKIPLDTDESTAAGYGPVCAKKYNLPWG